MLMLASRRRSGASALGIAASVNEPGTDEVRDLVARAQAGDVQAFGLLYDRYFTPVYRFVARRVGDRDLAEDLTAETFTRALAGLRRFHWQGRDIGAWLVTIARNLVADHWKSARTRYDCPSGLVGVDQVDTSRDASPEDLAVARSERVRLLAALEQLEPGQREVVVLRHLLELSVEQTAAALEITPGAVKARCHRGLQALARLLPQHEAVAA